MTPHQPKKFKFIDLFAGIGGFHHALSQLGGECVLAVEIDANCRKVYKTTWPKLADDAFIADIRSLTRNEDQSQKPLNLISTLVPDHDVLCAGFPCQPFSKSGNQEGILDQTRGTLFFDIMEIVKAKKPRYLILENVRNLAGPRHAETFRTIIASLQECGYRVTSNPVILSPHTLPPSNGGTPQHRERVYIMAEYVGASSSERELALDMSDNQSHAWNPTMWTLDSFLLQDDEIQNLERYRLSPEDEAVIRAWQAFVEGISDDRLPGFPIWVDYFKSRPRYPADTPEWKRNFIKKNSDFYRENKEFLDEWLKISWMHDRTFRVADFIASRRKFEWQARRFQSKRGDRDLLKLAIQFRPSGVRVKAPNYLPTLVAITQTPFIGPRQRFLTPIEAGRLQGFPDSVFGSAIIEDKHAYRQAGNAVNVGVVKYIATRLFDKTNAPWLNYQNLP